MPSSPKHCESMPSNFSQRPRSRERQYCETIAWQAVLWEPHTQKNNSTHADIREDLEERRTLRPGLSLAKALRKPSTSPNARQLRAPSRLPTSRYFIPRVHKLSVEDLPKRGRHEALTGPRSPTTAKRRRKSRRSSADGSKEAAGHKL